MIISNDEWYDLQTIRKAVTPITGTLQCLNVVEVKVTNNKGETVAVLRSASNGWEVEL